MNEKSLHTLEYDKVIAALGSQASFSASRDLAEGLRPITSLDEVIRAQAETAEARRLLEMRPDVTVGGARDVRPAVARAELGGMIDPADLLIIATTLASARAIKRLVQKMHEASDELSLLSAHAARLYDLQGLENRVRSSIGERGDVLDAASPALARVRAELRGASDRLQNLLRSIITSSTYAPAIQEPIITLREGRYVIPVKADFRSRLPGIVHDTSGSGQTLFVEPLGAVEAGNRWRELQRREEDEIERVLMELAGEVAEAGPELRSTVDALARIDFALAKARYAGRLRAVRPEIVAFDGSQGQDPQLRLPEARHPLLTGRVVPQSVDLGGPCRVLVITGPNTGGKTVALKTVGLLTLMALSGLHVPAATGARVPVLSEVWADIGDEQSIEQSLSTFSSHVGNIVRMLSTVGRDALVLLDELGAGTDPEEGSALARAIIDYLLEKGCLVVATTHYSELKSYAHSTPGVRNASVEFDLDTLSPTYRLVVGLPGRSNALTIAGRLGMPEEIVERAQARVRPESRELNDMLQQIQDERDAAVTARIAVEAERDAARKLADRARRELADAEELRAGAIDEGRQQAQAELEEFRRELAAIRREAQQTRREPVAAPVFQEAEDRVQELARATVPRPRRPPRPKPESRPLAAGDSVLVRSLGSTGRVLGISDGQAEVQLGALKTRLPLADLELQPEPAAEQLQRRTEYRLETPRQAPPMELDLRGQRAEEVQRLLDRYVDDAYLSGLPMLRIIHGKGTGALRRVVREFLTDHPLVTGMQGGDAQGGEGVTIATLASR